MTEVKKESGVTHIYLKETLTVRHEDEKKRRGRPKEEIPDINAVASKTLENLKNSEDFFKQWEALAEVLQACGSYRKAAKWIGKYCPSISTGRKQMAEILKSHAEMKEVARKKVREILEEAKKNPYLTDKELEFAIEVSIREFTKQKIRQSSTKYPIGTKSTDKKGQNLREWKLKKEAKKEEK